MREPQHGWVDTGEVRLHYWDWPGGEPALLCMHGLTANGRAWDALAEQISPRHRVIAMDLRGRGLSDKPPAGQYGIPAHARDMAAVVRALGTGPVVAVGSSMGAAIGILLVNDHPDLVSHLVLVDFAVLPRPQVSQEELEAELRKQGPSVMDRLTKVFPSMAAYLDFWRQGAKHIPWSEYFERYLRADVEERPDGSVVSRVSAAGVRDDIGASLSLNLEGAIPRIQVPTLILWAPTGMIDRARPAFPRDVMKQMIEVLPNGRMVTIEGANHHTIILSPDCARQVAVALDSFLDSGP